MAKVKCPDLPLDKQGQLHEMLVKLKAQCEDASKSCQDINWEGRCKLEQWLRDNGQWEGADFISEEDLFLDFDMHMYEQYSNVPVMVTKFGFWELRY
jgi:hypothetical protein